MLQTMRSHDQYNTTIYGLDDRYRGVKGGRRVVFVNPADIAALGFADGDRVDLVSECTDAEDSCRSAAPTTSGWCRTRRRAATRRLLPGDQSADPARPRGRQVQHPGVQGVIDPSGTTTRWVV